jgi:hypothetical protein
MEKKSWETDKDMIALSLAGAYGSNLISLFIYGSAVTPDYQPGVSDLNLGIVLQQNDLENIEKGQAALEKLASRGVKTPFFFTRHYLANSADSFAIEILNMKEEHAVIYGDDPFTEITVVPADVRLQSERELKGKLLHARSIYLNTHKNRKQVDAFLQVSVRELMPIFKALVYFKSKQFPRSRAETVKQTWELYKMDVSIFLEILRGDYRQESDYKMFFKKYISVIDGVSQAVDILPV